MVGLLLTMTARPEAHLRTLPRLQAGLGVQKPPLIPGVKLANVPVAAREISLLAGYSHFKAGLHFPS